MTLNLYACGSLPVSRSADAVGPNEGDGHATHRHHHLTAVTGDPPRNHDFYTRALGMRLVKKTPGEQSLQWWTKRFEEEGVTHGDIVERDGRKTLDSRISRGSASA